MKTVSIPQLQVFTAVARHSSFSVAARELRVSRSAASQAVRQLEEQLGVLLLTRTTRSVSLTDAAGVSSTAPGPRCARSPARSSSSLRHRTRSPVAYGCLSPVPACPWCSGRRSAFRERHPRIDVEVAVDDRLVDIVAEGYDAGVRLTDAIERDMVQVRLTEPFRFVVVGSPAYLARHGTPQRPADLLKHECITFRSRTTGALYAWELERGPKTWRVPVRGGFVSDDAALSATMAEHGHALAYTFEPLVTQQLRDGRLRVVLDAYAPVVPGYSSTSPASRDGRRRCASSSGR